MYGVTREQHLLPGETVEAYVTEIFSPEKIFIARKRQFDKVSSNHGIEDLILFSRIFAALLNCSVASTRKKIGHRAYVHLSQHKRKGFER